MKEEYGREWVRHGWSNSGRRGRDEGEKKGDCHPPHPKSPPTFQPWLRLYGGQRTFRPFCQGRGGLIDSLFSVGRGLSSVMVPTGAIVRHMSRRARSVGDVTSGRRRVAINNRVGPARSATVACVRSQLHVQRPRTLD